MSKIWKHVTFLQFSTAFSAKSNTICIVPSNPCDRGGTRNTKAEVTKNKVYTYKTEKLAE